MNVTIDLWAYIHEHTASGARARAPQFTTLQEVFAFVGDPRSAIDPDRLEAALLFTTQQLATLSTPASSQSRGTDRLWLALSSAQTTTGETQWW